MTSTKTIQHLLPKSSGHWVGDGFLVQSILSPRTVEDALSPFILFDYAAPRHFEPAPRPRGVDTHPHRGFETVTVVYQGELEHRDSAGNKGSLAPGDVQWMTAASGILHEEKHSARFTKEGGTIEMAQLWVNLPASEKMSPPRYQELTQKNIPTITLPDAAGTVRVIAGELLGTPGAARTVTPVILWDVTLVAQKKVDLPIVAGFNSGIFVRRGELMIDGRKVSVGEFVVLSHEGEAVVVAADSDAEYLVLGGQPLNEPVVAHGPFVMNTVEEIDEAISDLHAGKFGRLQPA